MATVIEIQSTIIAHTYKQARDEIATKVRALNPEVSILIDSDLRTSKSGWKQYVAAHGDQERFLFLQQFVAEMYIVQQHASYVGAAMSSNVGRFLHELVVGTRRMTQVGNR